jgi:hypothetical protein
MLNFSFILLVIIISGLLQINTKNTEHTATQVLGKRLFTGSLQSVDQAFASKVILGFGPPGPHNHIFLMVLTESTTDSLQIHSMSINTPTHTHTGANTDIIKLQRAVRQLSRKLRIAATRVRSQIRTYGIYGGQSGTRVILLRVLQSPLPIHFPPTNSHSLIIDAKWSPYRKRQEIINQSTSTQFVNHHVRKNPLPRERRIGYKHLENV